MNAIDLDSITPEKKQALREYLRIFSEIDALNASSLPADHGRLPKLRAELCSIRLAHGWHGDMNTHLTLLAAAKQLVSSEA